jgi:ABC-type oligopeptide transport system substrate-binding subunit
MSFFTKAAVLNTADVTRAHHAKTAALLLAGLIAAASLAGCADDPAASSKVATVYHTNFAGFLSTNPATSAR